MIRMLLVVAFFMFSKISVSSSTYVLYQGRALCKRRDSSSIQIPQSSKKDDWSGPYDCIKSFKEFDHCLVIKFMKIIGELEFLLTWMKKAHLYRQQQGQSLKFWELTTTHPSSHLKAKATALSGAESFSCELQSLWNPKESFKHSSLRARPPSWHF